MDLFHDQNKDASRSIVHSSDEIQRELPLLPTVDDHDQPVLGLRPQKSQNGSAKPAIGQLSKETWESLKPIIRTLYMGEGGSLARVTQHLSDEYGFLPT